MTTLTKTVPSFRDGEEEGRADFPGDRFEGDLTLREAALEVINWFDKDGSVGTLPDYIMDLRTAVKAAAAPSPDQGVGGGDLPKSTFRQGRRVPRNVYRDDESTADLSATPEATPSPHQSPPMSMEEARAAIEGLDPRFTFAHHVDRYRQLGQECIGKGYDDCGRAYITRAKTIETALRTLSHQDSGEVRE